MENEGFGKVPRPLQVLGWCSLHSQAEDSDELIYLAVVVQRMMNEICKDLSEECFCRHTLDCTDSYFKGHVEGILQYIHCILKRQGEGEVKIRKKKE